MHRIAIITSSDSGYKGEREDISGAVIRELAEKNGYEVVSSIVLPDERELLEKEMVRIADTQEADLLLTTGGTGFSDRDCMPEATAAVIQRNAPGIPEAMRYYSSRFTKRSMLSRASAGIREHTLIVNLPGSPKAVRECLEYIFSELGHGLDILTGITKNCGEEVREGKVIAACISEKKGTQKRNVHCVKLIPDWGIAHDAHAGNWHRQVSMLSYEKIEEFKERGAQVSDGDFGENLVVSGIDFKSLPVGTRFRCNEVILEMTQIGKECHNGCQIFQAMGDCIMPREGVFAKVLQGGYISEGDKMIVLK